MKKVIIQTIVFLKYNIILHCVFILYASVKSQFLKNKFGDICSVVYYFRT